MQTALFRVWTLVNESTSYNDNIYTNEHLVVIVIYLAFCWAVAQGHMNGGT